MNKKLLCLGSIALLFCVQCTEVTKPPPSQAELAVWVNEAIIATYTYDYSNYLAAQKGMAKYFTATAWLAYTKALNNSKLTDVVKSNAYSVSAVATNPPQILIQAPSHWKATMPLLVLYKGNGKPQQQNLEVTIEFTTMPANQGVRGLGILSMTSKVTAPPCECKPQP